MQLGFTENDVIRSNLIRAGQMTRQEALELVEQENRPRIPTLEWYCKVIQLNFEDVLSNLLGTHSYASKNKVVVIIPAFKAKNYLEQVLPVLEQGYGNILVVDDCCPEETFRVVENHNVNVLKLDVNKGVGGAFSAGFHYICNTSDFDQVKYIAKLDADDQHDPRCLETMHKLIEDTESDFVKGDRYALGREPKNQPLVRKVGNIGLTFLTKLSTGYWHLNDPLNGQFIGDIRFLKMVAENHGFENRYLFETSILVSASKLRAKVLDCPNLIKYGDEESSMKVSGEIKNSFFITSNDN